MTTARRRPGRLTDTQLGLLSTAAQRDDQLVVPEETMPEKAAAAALKPLLKHGLIAEVRVKRGQPHWHRNNANQRMGLRITAAGRERLGRGARAADETHDQSPRVGQRKRIGSSAPESSTRRSVPRTPGNAAASKPAPGRPGTKRALIASLLSRKEGASLAALVSATGWLPHTTRAALARLRQTGCTLERSKSPEGVTVYHLTSGAVETTKGKAA